MINEYIGGYDDWLIQKKPARLGPVKIKSVKEIIRPKKPVIARKLNSKEQCEFNSIPSVIEKMEVEQKQVYALLADFNFYQKGPEEIAKTEARLEFLSNEIEKAYARWEYLEELAL